jgi:hypothetical protein
MADPSPDDAEVEGQEPEPDEGQEPAQDEDDPGDGQKPEPRTYPEAYVRQLRREAAATRSKLAEVEEKLQEHEDRGKTEQERLGEKLTDAEKRAVDAETRLLRYEVAAERGLDMAAASFLTGTTREELELRAEELEKLLGETSKAKPAASFHGGTRQPVPEKGPPEKEHNEFLLRTMGRQPSR